MTLLDTLNKNDRFAASIGAQLTEIREGGNCHGILTLGISNTITFLKSAQLSDHLTAECTELLDHHKLPYCDIKVTNQQGELIAAMTGLAYRMKKDFPFEQLM